jgi:hypothetical protein
LGVEPNTVERRLLSCRAQPCISNNPIHALQLSPPLRLLVFSTVEVCLAAENDVGVEHDGAVEQELRELLAHVVDGVLLGLVKRSLAERVGQLD